MSFGTVAAAGLPLLLVARWCHGACVAREREHLCALYHDDPTVALNVLYFLTLSLPPLALSCSSAVPRFRPLLSRS